MTHVAGIGASAGGLEAMLQMFAHMQATGRVSYVVAQHMAKDGHDELVVRLMQRESVLPVVLGTQGMRLLADTVVVIPSGQDGEVRSGGVAGSDHVLALSAPHASHVSTPSANALMRSIATVCGKSAIGIVLSGTGTDGAQGCVAIRAAGGLTIAQDPAQAKFNGMPQSAIDSRTVDEVLPAQRMGEVLASRFPGKPAPGWNPGTAAASASLASAASNATATPLSPVSADKAPPDPALQELQQLLRQVQTATGIDFSSYKEDTLLRRLVKRKELVGADSPQAYQALIRRDATELHTLQHLFLVSVSSFFRDAASFSALKLSLAELVLKTPPSEPIRVWVPGCASGEEPYTLAVLLTELLKNTPNSLASPTPVRIIATDLNPEALELARAGIYRKAAFKEMDEGLRQRYFTPKGEDFEVSPALRKLVQFEQRDVLSGAPGDGLNLVSCRNLLIYMKSHLQDQLIKTFHGALRPQGLLFIGQSESLSFVGNSLFHPVDPYHRLFRKRH